MNIEFFFSFHEFPHPLGSQLLNIIFFQVGSFWMCFNIIKKEGVVLKLAGAINVDVNPEDIEISQNLIRTNLHLLP